MSALQLGQLQPTLQSEWSQKQLFALINFSMLFSDTILLHDTQLLDNPHVLEGFRARAAGMTGANLFNQLREGMSEGLVDVGIRDGMLVTPDDFRSCGALEDVVRSWIAQRMPGVGSVRSDMPFRSDVLELARDLDWTLNRGDRRPVRYDYIQVKSDFQDRIREGIDSTGSPLALELNRLPAEFVSRYREIVDRPWFSHNDVFQLARAEETATDLVMMQGYLDEAAYSAHFGIDLSGSDRRKAIPSRSAERLFRSARHRERVVTVDDLLLEHAAKLVEGPSLDALALLRIPDILELRALGADARALRANLVDGVVTSESEDLLLEAFNDYWKSIYSFIRKRFPMSSRRPTKLLIILRNRLPRVADFAVRGTRLAHRVAPSVVGSLQVPGQPATKSVFQAVSRYVGLEFLIFTHSDSFKSLKSTLPRNTWRVLVSERTQTRERPEIDR
ncbi:hypothetical protein [Streptosporangium sp. OZ121]|uniref:hypothetical protein n=1 Tax=Streptosporangium sp. OZ121 TaxID=3444183 RepID=UPI003F7A9062